MGKFYKALYRVVILLTLPFFLPSCVADEPDKGTSEPENYEKERLILIYAVAANNLQMNLKYDKDEILRVAPELNLHNNKVLVYSVVNSGQCVLQELQKNKSGIYEFTTIQEFPELPLSTSEVRIREVIDYVVENFDYPYKGLVLWSHADGWLPWHQSTPDEGPAQDMKRKSYGWDSYQGQVYKTNITSLADAIPSDTFDFIWFDCCYMANIETVYQLREKTDFIVGSVLEIASDGMPYDLTMPYLLQKDADLREAAFQFFNYYDSFRTPVSVSIMETSQLEALAEATRNIFMNGVLPESLNNIQTYQRNLNVKFYDMGQLLRSYTDVPDSLENVLDKTFDKAVTYKLISNLDFNNRPINVKDYSGLSMHNYVNSGSSAEIFYETLEWFEATRK